MSTPAEEPIIYIFLHLCHLLGRRIKFPKISTTLHLRGGVILSETPITHKRALVAIRDGCEWQ